MTFPEPLAGIRIKHGPVPHDQRQLRWWARYRDHCTLRILWFNLHSWRHGVRAPSAREMANPLGVQGVDECRRCKLERVRHGSGVVTYVREITTGG